MKVLHSADWHLDSPLTGRTSEQTELLRGELLRLPGKVVNAAREENCDLMLLAGDLFDGAYSRQSLDALRNALEDAAIPVFITPGNHDPVGSASPWTAESWPENVHIFTGESVRSVSLPELDCRVYGAAFENTFAPSLLEGFRASQEERYAVGVLHGDPTRADSPYCAVSAVQAAESGLDYLALGHIHKRGEFLAGRTLCAWPGCPMGRGYDETGEKGVLIAELGEAVSCRFLALDTLRFFDLECPAGENPFAALAAFLPPVGNQDFYRITLTGESGNVDVDALLAAYCAFPNLELRDRTVLPLDVWGTAGEDTLEGIYFGLLKASMEGQDEKTAERIALAAKISRKILSGQEVRLP